MSAAGAVLGAIALIAAGLLPAEHVHEARHDPGERSAIVHRHPQTHHGSGDGVHLEQPDDGLEIWVTSAAGITREVMQPGRALRLMANPLPAPAARSRPGPLVHDGGTSIHDPPWIDGLTLRGPPTLSA